MISNRQFLELIQKDNYILMYFVVIFGAKKKEDLQTNFKNKYDWIAITY